MIEVPGDDESSAVMIACVFDVGWVGTLLPEAPDRSLPDVVAFATATIAADEHPTT